VWYNIAKLQTKKFKKQRFKGDIMKLSECNPFLRTAQIQPAVLEGTSPRMAYDHRIFLILEGEGFIYISGITHPLRKNSLICFPPEKEYYFRGKMKVAVLNFDLTRAFQNQRKPLTPVPRESYDFASRFDMTMADGLESPVLLLTDEIERTAILRIISAFVSNSPYSDARTSADLKMLLAEILDSQTKDNGLENRLVEKILLYVRSNAAEIQSNAMLGNALGYHPNYIASVVRKKTGKSLHRILVEERIRLACRYLRSTDHSVEEIAYETGFSSRNHFCTTFRRITGTSPLSYRNK
jgi:AraC-like DNA-binding protein/mannose-6-phosphate isomerase-like protein (cupin superfamily)